MRTFFLIVACTFGLMLHADDAANKSEDVDLLSEAFGHFIVKSLNAPGIHLKIDKVIQGMQDAVAGKPSPLSDEEYEAGILAMQEQAFSEAADENLKEANEFLAKNASAEGVVVLIPGKLQYKILQPGKGAEVQPHSTPLIHYTGRFADGTIFGSSLESGEPIALPLDQTIPGFSTGLVGMKEGEKRLLFVHPDLAYGTSGQLPPNKLLIFEVEVVKANVEGEAAPLKQ